MKMAPKRMLSGVASLFFGVLVFACLAGVTDTGRVCTDKGDGTRTRCNPPGRERAGDGVVHLQTDMVYSLPSASRLCDSMESLSKRRVKIGDCELYCELAGEGVPLVLIHGGPGGTHHSFHPYFSRAERFAGVVYYDQRGCGLSGYVEGDGYTIDQAVNDLDRLRKALEIDRWIVLGWSYGGLLAQCYSVRYPQRTAGLVLVNSKLATWSSLKPSRQQRFLSAQERERIRDILNTPELSTPQKLYNRFLNGDWKRQHYYKPTKEEISRIALYEWQSASGFRHAISSSVQQVDLRGAFRNCPIPTLIFEGRWDLTWGTDKPDKLHQNHPHARLIFLEQSAHRPFADEPEQFFSMLEKFIRDLPAIPQAELDDWNTHLIRWRIERSKSVEHLIRSVDEGQTASARLVGAYAKKWLEKLGALDDAYPLKRVGLALYDMQHYAEALTVFQRIENNLDEKSGAELAEALIWQGHMLDLLGRRNKAIQIYRRVVALNEYSAIRWDQYGLSYVYKPYALERTRVPFTRLENIGDELRAD